MRTLECDLVAVGGGTAGLVSAAGASHLGLRAGLVEKEALGGDCLWTGCIPAKALVASARLAHAMRHASALGLKGAAPVHAFSEVMERMRGARERVAHHDDPERFREMGVGVHFGSARFLGPETLEVEGVGRIRSKRIVLATGASVALPPLQGLKEAGYMAKTALQNAIFPIKKKVDYRNVPWVTYTDPEVARVGLGRTEAEDRGGSTFTYPFHDLDRAIADGETRGFVRISADRKGRILGATILGHGAGELLLPIVLAKQHGISLSRISGTIFPYPTRMEGVKRAADAFQRTRLEGTGGKVLRKVVSWLA